MFQNIENRLTMEVEGVDLTTVINIEVYVKQNHRFFTYAPTVLSADTMTITVPMIHARSLSVGTVEMQFAFTYGGGAPGQSEVVEVPVERFLKEAGYEPII